MLFSANLQDLQWLRLDSASLMQNNGDDDDDDDELNPSCNIILQVVLVFHSTKLCWKP